MNKQMHVMDSPVGPLTLVADTERLLELRFGKSVHEDFGIAKEVSSPAMGPEKRAAVVSPILRQAEKEVREFFEGKRHRFSVPLALEGTPFQNRVWKALSKIPFGATCSYSELAKKIGSPKSARAVGMALGRNRLAIVIPCHRVIGQSGSLVGFGGGLEIKRRLLELESTSDPG
jgi:O-6-methylguanine DNA methyltransferase